MTIISSWRRDHLHQADISKEDVVTVANLSHAAQSRN